MFVENTLNQNLVTVVVGELETPSMEQVAIPSSIATCSIWHTVCGC